MPNLYGVATPVMYPAFQYPVADVACPAGVETNVIDSGALTALSPGVVYPGVFLVLVISLGATAASQIQIGTRIGAGADFATMAPSNLFLAANANLTTSGFLFGPIGYVPWQSPGSHIYVTVNPTGQAVTLRSYGSYAQFFLNRAPDQ